MKRSLLVLAAVFFVASCGGSGTATTEDASTDNETTTTSVEPANSDAAPIVGAEEPYPGAVDDDTIEILGQYAIDPATDDLLGDVPPDQDAIWERFSELIPADVRPEVHLFVAIDQEASDGTDGAMQTSPDDLGFYYIALDTTGSSAGAELDRTMIHEFAHLLSLGPRQITIDVDTVQSCEVYANDTGCPEPGTYLYDFSLEYWPDWLLDDEYPEAVDTFEATPDAFVTEYAATNPAEDLAEIFAEWVLADELPEGDLEKWEKMQFFEDYPEAVELREEIRASL